MPTSPLIPKEQQSAYQRWELGSFNAAPPPVTAAAAAADQERARQLDGIARGEAFKAGHREGFEAGKLQALSEAAPRIARMDELLAALQSDLQRVDRELASEVVQLGLALARKLVGASLKIRPEVVQECVEEALRHVVQAPGPVNVIVHPDDAELVRAHLEVSPRAGAWALKEDSSIARGGCRIQTGAGEVDATLNHRWERITAALGEPSAWIE